MAYMSICNLECLPELTQDDLLTVIGGISWGQVAFYAGAFAFMAGIGLATGGVGAIVYATTVAQVVAGGSAAITGLTIGTAGFAVMNNSLKYM